MSRTRSIRHTCRAIRRISLIALGAAALLLAGASPPASAKVRVVGDDSPAWSPDGNEIAFTSFRDGQGDLYVMQADGTGQRRLTESPAYDDLAAWSPDGTRIAFTSTRSGTLQVWIMNADGSGQKQLTSDDNGTNYFSTWSPDGRRIAFRSDRDRNPEIYSMNADGSDARRLTTNLSSDYAPNWGPDGRILFVSNRDSGGKTSLWVMNGDGSDQHRFTPESFFWNETSPVWSPDGTHVLFQADRDVPLGNTELYVMSSDSSALTRLTTYPGQDNLPTWSPDGKRIAFARGPTPYRNEIYSMNANGSDTRELTIPKLVGVDIGTIPARPSAGHAVTVVYDVAAPSGGGDIASPTVRCSARVKGRLLSPRSRTFTRAIGRAACIWRLPRSSRGQLFSGTISVHGQTGTISQRFSLRVR